MSAQSSVLFMNAPGRRNVQANPASRTAASTAAYSFPLDASWPSPTLLPDSATPRETSASDASSQKRRTVLAIGARYTAETPFSATGSVDGFASDPTTTSASDGSKAREGSTVSARTGTPAATSSSTTRRPTLPVAPVTRIVIAPSSFPYAVRDSTAYENSAAHKISVHAKKDFRR